MPPEPLSDTSAAAERLLIEGYRRMPTWRKLQLVAELNASVDALAIAGLRQRHPTASAAELKRRLASLKLGDELAAKVFGPLG